MKRNIRKILPQLSRRGKFLRNLLVVGMLLYSVWAIRGYCPLPTEEMEFRRLERQNLLGPTQIILHIPDEMRSVTGEVDGIYRTKRVDQPDAQFVGLGDGYAITAVVHPFSNSGAWFEYWPLEKQEEKIKLIPLLSIFGDWRGGEERLRNNWEHIYNCGIVIPELPAGASQAEMFVWEGEEEYHDWGTWEEPGSWLFGFQRRADGVGSDWLLGLPYVLVVYDERGEILVQQDGNVPSNRP